MKITAKTVAAFTITALSLRRRRRRQRLWLGHTRLLIVGTEAAHAQPSHHGRLARTPAAVSFAGQPTKTDAGKERR